jgi:hypothetical protein
MNKTLALALVLAATIGTAAAQEGRTGGANTGGTSTGANGNNNVSSGNSSNTSSSAGNNNPTTAKPNYKPAPGARRTSSGNPKGSPKDAKQVVSTGGQGHNTTPEPKGKIQVAPSVTTGKGKK